MNNTSNGNIQRIENRLQVRQYAREWTEKVLKLKRETYNKEVMRIVLSGFIRTDIEPFIGSIPLALVNICVMYL